MGGLGSTPYRQRGGLRVEVGWEIGGGVTREWDIMGLGLVEGITG